MTSDVETGVQLQPIKLFLFKTSVVLTRNSQKSARSIGLYEVLCHFQHLVIFR